MNDSFSFNSPSSSFMEQSDERLRASFQTLSEIKQSFYSNDPNTIADSILLLIRQANS